MSDYDKPPELYDGLRLHQNENTGGCSPRVLDALRAQLDSLRDAPRVIAAIHHLPFRELLPDTQDRAQAGVDRASQLSTDHVVRLAGVAPSLGMPDDHPRR